ncbi:MAG: SDR family NAD(P)-dependent oxidoreductase [Rhizobiaceae bacterium]
MAKVAVVTGAASGIGRTVAARLHADGFRVALLDLDEAKAVEAAREISAESAAGYRCDITDLASVVAARGRIAAELGAPSVVVNCAGWSVIQPFAKNDEAFWNRAISINLTGTVAVTHVFLEDLIAAGEGRVINIASDAGRVGSTGETAYSAAKGGVIAFTKSLAREMARHKITANCVCPGPTETPMLMVQDPQRIEALTKAVPMRRLAKPDDIANAVSFFAASGSGYVTGQVLSVSGGLTMAG